jgi:hypothetical protein
VLLKKLFPKATCSWVDALPVRDDAYLSIHQLPWIGFISTEELRSVLIQCQNPEKLMASKSDSSLRQFRLTCIQQGRYNGSNPERVYEMMMSSVQKVRSLCSNFLLKLIWADSVECSRRPLVPKGMGY